MVKPGSDIDIQNAVMTRIKKIAAPKSVLRTASILTCLSNGVNSITDIARVCQTNKSTVHRLLQALGDTGLTLQDPINHRYYIGPLITEIASNPYVTHEHLISCSTNEMRYLSNLTGESIGLSILVGLKGVVLNEIESIYDFAITSKKRTNTSLHAGAHSKAMLSLLNSKELKVVLTNIVLEPLTEHTVTYKDQLMVQLKQVKRQGYAISYSEVNNGAACLSVPLKNYILPAALSILGPESRVRPREAEFVNELIASGNRVQHNIAEIFQETN